MMSLPTRKSVLSERARRYIKRRRRPWDIWGWKLRDDVARALVFEFGVTEARARDVVKEEVEREQKRMEQSQKEEWEKLVADYTNNQESS